MGDEQGSKSRGDHEGEGLISSHFGKINGACQTLKEASVGGEEITE